MLLPLGLLYIGFDRGLFHVQNVDVEMCVRRLDLRKHPISLGVEDVLIWEGVLKGVSHLLSNYAGKCIAAF